MRGIRRLSVRYSSPLPSPPPSPLPPCISRASSGWGRTNIHCPPPYKRRTGRKYIAKYEIFPPGMLLIAARWDPWRNNAKPHILWIAMRCVVAVFDVGLKNPKHSLGLNITLPKKVWKSFSSTPSYPFNRCVCVGNGTRGVQYGNHESASSSSACASFIASQCTQPSPASAEQGWPRCRVARHARFTLRNWLLTNKSIVRPIWISVPRHSKWKTRLQALLGHLATIIWEIGSHLFNKSWCDMGRQRCRNNKFMKVRV